jgi:hypothetical protein
LIQSCGSFGAESAQSHDMLSDMGPLGGCEGWCCRRKDGVSSLEKMIFDIRHDHPSGIFVRVALYRHLDLSYMFSATSYLELLQI